MTPAKTPLSTKFKRQLSKTNDARATGSRNHNGRSGKSSSNKRLQLFGDQQADSTGASDAHCATETYLSSSVDAYSMKCSKEICNNSHSNVLSDNVTNRLPESSLKNYRGASSRSSDFHSQRCLACIALVVYLTKYLDTNTFKD